MGIDVIGIIDALCCLFVCALSRCRMARACRCP